MLKEVILCVFLGLAGFGCTSMERQAALENRVSAIEGQISSASDSGSNAAAVAQAASREASAAKTAADRALDAANVAIELAQQGVKVETEEVFTPVGPRPDPSESMAIWSPSLINRDPRTYNVWFGTNRAKGENGRFSNKDASKLTYGIAEVFVPESHRFGEVGSSWIVRTITRKDDRLRIRSRHLFVNKDQFARALSSELNLHGQAPSALVYVHGFNNTFDDAVIRAAQMGYDLKVQGITALFSWPSAGSKYAYRADATIIESSEVHLEQFLRAIISNPDVDDVNIIAHSMGNRALLRVADRLALDESLPQKPINQIILAAPDVDATLFSQLATAYPRISNRTTLYVSDEDKALSVSGFLNAFRRAGLTPPVTIVDGLNTVAVEDIDVSFLGHGYFSEAEALLYDIYELLRFNTSPDERQRLSPTQTAEGDKFWFFKR